MNKTSLKTNEYYWESIVRDYELDMQGIVNNAVYLNYCQNVRDLHLCSLGLDWKEWHQRGFDFVLVHVDLSLKRSLRAGDAFYIESNIQRKGRLRLVFDQKIFHSSTQQLAAHAINTAACVDVKQGRPVMPDEIIHTIFTGEQHA